ncbi:hypothetical protein AB0467_13590 [Streptomyces sp. NPDC052095]|uniref:hypothetical protein n=1 Tax=unclassified Streptomyces TaxID=2593676 RepID=UPI00344EF57B
MREVSHSRFVLDRAAVAAFRLWLPAVGVYATAIMTNRGVLEWMREIPLWNIALVLVFVVQPLLQARNPMLARAARADGRTCAGRLGVLAALAVVNAVLLFVLGVALGGAGEFGDRLDGCASFFLTPGFVFLNLLLSFYSFAVLRPFPWDGRRSGE